MSVELTRRHTVDGNVFIARLELDNWSSSDLELIKAFGDPIVDAGGSFSDSPTEFELPTNEVRMMRDFPLVQRFDGSEDPDVAEAQRDLWSDTLQERIVDALAELRARAVTTITTRTINTI